MKTRELKVAECNVTFSQYDSREPCTSLCTSFYFISIKRASCLCAKFASVRVSLPPFSNTRRGNYKTKEENIKNGHKLKNCEINAMNH